MRAWYTGFVAVFPHTHRKYEWWVLGLIMLVAFVFRFQDIKSIPPGLYPDEAMNGNNAIQALETGEYKIFYPENNGRDGLFINIQAQSLRIFGYHPWALRIVSALFGLLTVLGTYLLAKRLFNWQIAAFSGFLLAVSFWHTLFSRIGFRAIMAPCLLVWGLYFFWRGKTSLKLVDFAISGALIGLGMYSYIAYRVMPLAVIITLLAYWHAIKRDYGHEKYLHTRNRLIRGFAMLMVSAIFVALPIMWYYYVHPDDFLGRTAQVSIFSSEKPLQTLIKNTGKTLGMFNIVGDHNWRHNIAGRPLLFWPVGVFFVIGFIKSWYKLLRHRKRHGHFPTVHVLLQSWFILGLVPVIISSEGLPHALRAIVVVPVAMIFAGEGLWWLYDFCRKWYGQRDAHELVVHEHHGYEKNVVATLAVCLLLFGVMISEYRAYFSTWAKNLEVAGAFAQNYASLGELLNSMPRNQKLYVLVNEGGVLVNGIPMPAQTVMFITDTFTAAKQKSKNIYYLTQAQYDQGRYDKNAIVLPLKP